MQDQIVLLSKEGDTDAEIARKLDLTAKELGDAWDQLEKTLKVLTQEESVQVVLARMLVKARLALAEENAEFALILGSPKEHAVLTLNSAGIVTAVSQDSEKVLGVSADRLIGKTVDSLLAGRAAEVRTSSDEMHRAETEGAVESERTHSRSGGPDFVAHHTIFALVGPTGLNTGFVRTICELSSRRYHEIKVAELEQTIALLVE